MQFCLIYVVTTGLTQSFVKVLSPATLGKSTKPAPRPGQRARTNRPPFSFLTTFSSSPSTTLTFLVSQNLYSSFPSQGLWTHHPVSGAFFPSSVCTCRLDKQMCGEGRMGLEVNIPAIPLLFYPLVHLFQQTNVTQFPLSSRH